MVSVLTGGSLLLNLSAILSGIVTAISVYCQLNVLLKALQLGFGGGGGGGLMWKTLCGSSDMKLWGLEHYTIVTWTNWSLTNYGGGGGGGL